MLDIEHESQLIVMLEFYPEASCTLSSANSRIKWEKSISSVSSCSIWRIARLLRCEAVIVERRGPLINSNLEKLLSKHDNYIRE